MSEPKPNESEQRGGSCAPAARSASVRLQQVLIEWRAAEIEHARAVLCAAHPQRIRELADAMERALHHVRLNVDSEPWSEIARDEMETPNDKLDRSGTMKTPTATEDAMPDSVQRLVMPDRPKTQATMLPGGAIVQAPIPEEPPETPEDVARKAEHLSIVMAYEAMRICLGQPTKYHRPEAVLRWMELMARGHI